MKRTPYLLLLLLLFQSNLLGQELTITIGRGPDCLGRGACSISASKTNSENASILLREDGVIILRVYREKLNADEHNRLLEQPITQLNYHYLKFQLEEDLAISEKIKSVVPKQIADKMGTIKAKSYPTFITQELIDIILIQQN